VIGQLPPLAPPCKGGEKRFFSPYQGEIQRGINMTRLFNRSTEKEKRKLLRINMPPAEVILWSQLKVRQLNGYKFRRQYSIDKFVVDL